MKQENPNPFKGSQPMQQNVQIKPKHKIDLELHEKLKNPIDKEALKPHPSRSYLTTIKDQYVWDRLNDVFGVQGWYNKVTVIETREVKKRIHVVVEVTLFARTPDVGDLISRTTFGGNDNDDLGDAYKGAVTDALSKCASMLYVATDVYKGIKTHKTFPKKTSTVRSSTKKVTQQASSQHPVEDLSVDLIAEMNDDKELKKLFSGSVGVGMNIGLSYKELSLDQQKFDNDYEFTRKGFKNEDWIIHKSIIDKMVSVNLVKPSEIK